MSARFPVILSDPKQSEGESKNLRSIDSAKILRLRALHSAQDDMRLAGGLIGNSAQSPPCLKGGGSPTGEPGGYRTRAR